PTMKELEDHYADYVITKTPEDELLLLTSLSAETLRFYLKKTEFANAPSPAIRFLEMGFGNGAGLFAGAKLGWKSYGVDLDPVCVANARGFAEKHSIPATCVQGGVNMLPHLGVEFDLVKASQ